MFPPYDLFSDISKILWHFCLTRRYIFLFKIQEYVVNNLFICVFIIRWKFQPLISKLSKVFIWYHCPFVHSFTDKCYMLWKVTFYVYLCLSYLNLNFDITYHSISSTISMAYHLTRILFQFPFYMFSGTTHALTTKVIQGNNE